MEKSKLSLELIRKRIDEVDTKLLELFNQRADLVHEVEKRLLAKGAKKVNAQVYKWNERSSEFFKAIGYETQPDLIMIGKQLRK